jgi:dTMP kinase
MTRTKRNYKGLFISFDGPDGGGKSTQIKILAEKLTAAGYTVKCTREPGGTYIGEHLRALLKEVHGEFAPRVTAELLMFGAARAQHLDEVIIPALNDGEIVISDRFLDSTTAYQGYGRGIDLDLIQQVHDLSVGNMLPDATLFLDLDPMINEQRILERVKTSKEAPCRFDSEKMEFKKKVHRGYRQIANNDELFKRGRITMIDASGSVEQVFTQVWITVSQKITDLHDKESWDLDQFGPFDDANLHRLLKRVGVGRCR